MVPKHQADYDFFIGMNNVPQVGSITTTVDTVLLKKTLVADTRKMKYHEFEKKNADKR